MSVAWNRLLIALSLVALVACRQAGTGPTPAPSPPPPPPPPPPPAPVAVVSVALAGVSVVVGQTTQATAELKDASGQAVTGRSIVWSSSDQGTASVSAAGLVTGVAPGSVTISATSEGKVGSATLEVAAVPVATVTVSLEPTSVEIGQAGQAAVELRGGGGEILTGREVAWSTSDETVATVSSSGVVTGLAVGTVSIMAIAEGVTGEAELVVTPIPVVPVATVTVSLAASSLLVGDQTAASAELRSADDEVLSRPITWLSETPAVATISADGLILGVAPGSTVIRATAEGKTATAVLTVSAHPVATVQIVVPASLVVGQTATAGVTLRDGDGRLLTGRAVTWKSSAPAVATISQLGIVTGVSPGTTTITATSEGKSDAVSVTVSAPAARLEITRNATSAASGQLFPTQPIVVVKDAWNNVVATDHATVISVSVSAGATISGAGSQVVSAGAASFAGIGLSGAAGSYTLTFSAPGLTPASQSIAIDQTAPASFGTGTKRVGADIAAGLYRSSNPTSAACYWERLSGFGGDLGDIIANEVSGGPVVVAIAPTDAGFNSAGCATWNEVVGPVTSSPTADFDDGSYVVGTDISPGTWRSTGTGSSCIWARLSGFGGTLAEVVAADFVTAPATVTIASTDKGFAASGCGVWTKIS